MRKLSSFYYTGIVRKELQDLDVKATDRILCIGGGAVPFTALQIEKLYKVKVDVVDIDREAIDKSRSLIATLGLQDRIKIIYKDGMDIDVGKYDIVHIALQVCPKDKIVARIYRDMSKGNRLVVRRPKKLLCSFYSLFNLDCEKGDMKVLNCRNSIFSTMSKPLVVEKLI